MPWAPSEQSGQGLLGSPWLRSRQILCVLRDVTVLQRAAKELEHLQLAQQVQQAAADSAKLMAPVARRKVRKEIEKVHFKGQPISPCCSRIADGEQCYSLPLHRTFSRQAMADMESHEAPPRQWPVIAQCRVGLWLYQQDMGCWTTC